MCHLFDYDEYCELCSMLPVKTIHATLKLWSFLCAKIGYFFWMHNVHIYMNNSKWIWNEGNKSCNFDIFLVSGSWSDNLFFEQLINFMILQDYLVNQGWSSITTLYKSLVQDLKLCSYSIALSCSSLCSSFLFSVSVQTTVLQNFINFNLSCSCDRYYR